MERDRFLHNKIWSLFTLDPFLLNYTIDALEYVLYLLLNTRKYKKSTLSQTPRFIICIVLTAMNTETVVLFIGILAERCWNKRALFRTFVEYGAKRLIDDNKFESKLHSFAHWRKVAVYRFSTKYTSVRAPMMVKGKGGMS